MPNPNKRMTCEKALEHPWIVENQLKLSMTEKSEVADCFERLKEFK